MILVDKTILEEMENGNIVVDPFERKNLGTNSIDLTLNPFIKTYTNAENYHSEVNVHGRSFCEISGNRFQYTGSIDGYFLDCKKQNETISFEIHEEGFILKPGQLYIASTNERTKTLNAVPKLEGKSSLGRLGLFVHVTAGYGDVGFDGTWTLELVATVPLKIYPNMKICQISYHAISDTPLVRYDEKEDAKYSGQSGATASKMEENFSNQ